MGYIHSNIDPILLKLGVLKLHWYGLLFVSGLLLGYWIMEKIFKRENKDTNLLEPLFFYMVTGIIIGARLAHCLIYEPDFYLSHPIQILFVWRGGLASHGGVIGAIIALWLFCKKYKISFLWLFSRLAIPLFLLAGFIRIGNFFNSEILGRATDVPWAIVFERFDQTPRHPVMLYESLGYFMIFAIGWTLYKRWDRDKFTYLYPGIALILGFSLRFFLEDFKMRQADYNTGILLMGQWLSLPFIFIGVAVLIWGYKQYKKHPNAT